MRRRRKGKKGSGGQRTEDGGCSNINQKGGSKLNLEGLKNKHFMGFLTGHPQPLFHLFFNGPFPASFS